MGQALRVVGEDFSLRWHCAVAGGVLAVTVALFFVVGHFGLRIF